MNIAFVYAEGRRNRYAETVQGHAATEFFYGALELEQRGHVITHCELGHGEITKLWQKVADKLYRWRMLPTRTSGVILAELHDMCPSLNKADVIVATTTAAAFGLSTLKLFGFVHRPVVAIHCGITNYKLAWLRRKLNSISLKHMWTQLFGEGELRAVKKYYGVPDSRIEVNQFGVDTEFWKPDDSDGHYILAVGNDERRDYELLMRVAREVNVKFKVVTRRKIKSDIPPNVEIIKGGWHEQALTDDDLRVLYQKARVVVIPLINSPQPSGQSVCLQAMACGKPVIITDTLGLWSRAMIRDKENVLLTPPNDANALIEAVNLLSRDVEMRERLAINARITACSEGHISGFSKRLESLCTRVFNNEGKT